MLRTEDIAKGFGTKKVLRGISMEAPEREVFCILGRSGCGKTTLLKCLAGLEQPDAGRVMLDETDITGAPPQKRDILYLYQEPLLFPHLSVFENIAFGLRIRKRPEAEIRERADKLLEELELSGEGEKAPHQLSGGQRQRVAFGRAIIVQPKVLLLDEPFSNLDAQTRANMQVLFRKLASRHRITSIFVTHDIREALTVGDRFGFMDGGTLENFPEREAFIKDRRSGAREEFDFWNNLFDHGKQD
ncbi:MAG: ABC transporter ATP-binding protein [Lewinellaceae bacterium]|nr:ABC transporter ATP-binding protein [Lewinella sp.]MCB9279847.1 ABC transporter ATP-binding protein [Lewinellaceae bacterium]